MPSSCIFKLRVPVRLLPVTAEPCDRVIQGGRKDGEGEEDGEGQEAKLDQAHLPQVQPHSEAKVERGRN